MGTRTLDERVWDLESAVKELQGQVADGIEIVIKTRRKKKNSQSWCNLSAKQKKARKDAGKRYRAKKKLEARDAEKGKEDQAG